MFWLFALLLLLLPISHQTSSHRLSSNSLDHAVWARGRKKIAAPPPSLEKISNSNYIFCGFLIPIEPYLSLVTVSANDWLFSAFQSPEYDIIKISRFFGEKQLILFGRLYMTSLAPLFPICSGFMYFGLCDVVIISFSPPPL